MKLVDLKVKPLINKSVKVVGVGGGAGNMLNSLVDKGIEGVEIIAINTDRQSLDFSKADIKIQIGKNLTKGLGTGANTAIGCKAVEESSEEITEALSGSDMVFITAGMGGGTGSGSSPLVAKIAKNLGILVVAIITKPFDFEGRPRMNYAIDGINKIRDNVDSLIIFENQNVLNFLDINATKRDAFELSNTIIYYTIKLISQMLTSSGDIRVDIEDLKNFLSYNVDTQIAFAQSTGKDRIKNALSTLLTNPLPPGSSINNPKYVLVNIAFNKGLKFTEFQYIINSIKRKCGTNSKYIFCTSKDLNLSDEICIMIIGSGNKTVARNNKQIKNVVQFPLEAYRGDKPYIFICYSHENKTEVYKEIDNMNDLGFRIWYDEGIKPSTEWSEEIAKAIVGASFFIVYFSNSAISSINVTNEINFALNKKKPFLAIFLEETKLTDGLQLRTSQIQSINKWELNKKRYVKKLSSTLPKELIDR